MGASQFTLKRTHKQDGVTLEALGMQWDCHNDNRRTLTIRTDSDDVMGDHIELTRAQVRFLIRELPALEKMLHTGKGDLVKPAFQRKAGQDGTR